MPARNMSKFLQQLIQRKYQYNDVRQGPEKKKKIKIYTCVCDGDGYEETHRFGTKGRQLNSGEKEEKLPWVGLQARHPVNDRA